MPLLGTRSASALLFRGLGARFYGVKAFDPVVALVASYVPAVREQ